MVGRRLVFWLCDNHHFSVSFCPTRLRYIGAPRENRFLLLSDSAETWEMLKIFFSLPSFFYCPGKSAPPLIYGWSAITKVPFSNHDHDHDHDHDHVLSMTMTMNQKNLNDPQVLPKDTKCFFSYGVAWNVEKSIRYESFCSLEILAALRP